MADDDDQYHCRFGRIVHHDPLTVQCFSNPHEQGMEDKHAKEVDRTLVLIEWWCGMKNSASYQVSPEEVVLYLKSWSKPHKFTRQQCLEIIKHPGLSDLKVPAAPKRKKKRKIAA